MEIDESVIYYKDREGYVFVDENKALACLLADDICFLNVREGTTVVYVIANDVFAWGCADAENITNSDGDEDSEIYALYKFWKENQTYGPIKWLCLKRNEQPQDPIRKRMIEVGYWDETLEKLPPNYYWTKMKSDHQIRKEKYSKLSEGEKERIINVANGVLSGTVGDHPVFMKAMNEGCGYFLKPETDIKTNYIKGFCKSLIGND